MKLNKKSLITLVNKIEREALAAQADYDKARAAYAAQELAKWKDEELPRFKALRDLLSAKLKAKATLTKDEVMGLGLRNRYSDVLLPFYTERTPTVFEFDGKQYKGRPELDSRLARLRLALSVVDEDEVTTTALVGLGFRNMEWFFVKAAQQNNEDPSELRRGRRR